MSTPKVNCPICGQEFPAYDQRGFRNAGYTAHHNRCMERQHQQQNESNHPTQLSPRASRLALARRRQLLPALPTPINLIVRGRDRISLAPTLPSHDNSTRSDIPLSIMCNLTPQINLQHHFPETPLQQLQTRPTTRQRHTWNHWNVRNISRRRTMNSISSVSSATLTSAISTPLPTLFRNIRDRRSLPVINTSTEYATSPLIRPMTVITTDTTSMINNTTIASTTLPIATTHLSSEPLYSPTMLTGNFTPFTFTSMLTTLPMETTSSLPANILFNPSASNISNFDYRDSGNIHLTLCQQQSMASTASPDWALSYHSPTESSGSNQYHHCLSQHQLQSPRDGQQHHQPFDLSNSISAFQSPDNSTDHQRLDTLDTTSSNVDALPTYLNDQHPLVLSCRYCRPQNGLHRPSCSLMQLFMANLMNDTDDSFPLT